MGAAVAVDRSSKAVSKSRRLRSTSSRTRKKKGAFRWWIPRKEGSSRRSLVVNRDAFNRAVEEDSAEGEGRKTNPELWATKASARKENAPDKCENKARSSN